MPNAADKRIFVITSPALPGVAIQLDSHGAKRLAMTLQEFCRKPSRTLQRDHGE